MVSQEGIASLKRLGVQLRGLLELADALEGVNSIEQSADEARGRLNSIGKQIEAATSELATLKDGIDAVNAEAEQIRAMAVQHAERIKAQVEADAQSVKDEANAVATAALSEASQKALQIVSEASAKAQQSIVKAEAAQARKAAFDNAIAEKTTELTELNGKITEAREQIARLLGR